MSHLGHNIARLRGFRQLPQKEMALKLHMAQQTYSALENKADIDDDLLEKIAAALDFPVTALKELDKHSIFTINQQGDNPGNVFHQHSPDEKLQELYERTIKEKDELIRQKDKLIEQKNEMIEMYKQQIKVS